MPEGALTPDLDTIASLVESVLRAGGPRPVVTVSWAQSRDGAIAPTSGRRVVLSSPESMALTHRLRSLHEAILVGIGTVLSDDPQLTVRLVKGPSPQPVVLDSALRFPESARLFSRTDHAPWIFHADTALEDKARELSRRGARLFALPSGRNGLPLDEVLHTLQSQGVTSLMVEGGAQVLRSFLSAGLARQAVITISPMKMQGLRVFEERPAAEGLLEFEETSEMSYGQDLVRWGRFCPTRSETGPFSFAR
ncbi:MAG TPA: RibD family protein [Spirochaetia bacterium]|nr:RibD family protein [Spirochaetia bacterium]